MSLTWARRRRPEPEPVACGHGEEIAGLEAEVGRLRAQIARQQDEWQHLNMMRNRARNDLRDTQKLLGAAIDQVADGQRKVAELTAALAQAAEGRDTALGLLEAREERPEWPDAGAVTARSEVEELRAQNRALNDRLEALQRANASLDWGGHPEPCEAQQQLDAATAKAEQILRPAINNESTTGGAS